jgi:uncharacterized protein (TIGR02246 family)
MNGESRSQRAQQPGDLGRLFEARLNAADLEGLLALYEPDGVLHFPPGNVATGTEAIRAAYEQALAGKPHIGLEPKSALEAGDLALLSNGWTMSFTGPDGQPVTMSGITAEVARRQADGTWLWVIDDPTIGG